MKKARKLVAVLLTLAMVFAMAMSAFAADVTVKGTDAGSTYSAYKLMDATVNATNNTKVTYTVNSKYSEILKTVSGEATDADVITYVNNLSADEVRTFADEVYAAITADASITVDKTTTADTDGKASFTGLDTGYYLVAETLADDNTSGTVSLVMLDTATGTTEVTPKEGTPVVQKKVKETNDTTGNVTDWQDAADYDIGDAVPFQLTGTVSEKIGSYETYYYEFCDTLSKGLTYNKDVKVMIGETDVTSSFTVTAPANDDGTTSLSIKCTDLKAIDGVTVDAATKVVVEYTAELNEDAVIGSKGNPNVVYLKYANNPYSDGDGDNNTGKTPEDKVIVFTYEIRADKVDGDGSALTGAGFTLYKYDAYEGNYKAVGNEVKGTDLTTFEFKGTDAGKYKLVETTVPGGYKQADDVIFEVTATYNTDAQDPELTDMDVLNESRNSIKDTTFTINVESGLLATTVKNYAGTALPGTGGIGTTIFYVLGTILVLGAGVVLIARKRVSTK